jgi:hypothetical protein
LHITVLDYATVTMIGVLAETIVCDHQKILASTFEYSDSALSDSILRVSLAANTIFVVWNSEQYY